MPISQVRKLRCRKLNKFAKSHQVSESKAHTFKSYLMAFLTVACKIGGAMSSSFLFNDFMIVFPLSQEQESLPENERGK